MSTQKKNGYQIDFTTNTVTVTNKFLTAAGQIGTKEFETMCKLRELNLTIVTKDPVKKKNTALTYSKMQKYISCLDEADKYQAMFEAIHVESMSMPAPYHYVVAWFHQTFPKYGKLPEHDVEMRIVNTPVEYQDVA